MNISGMQSFTQAGLWGAPGSSKGSQRSTRGGVPSMNEAVTEANPETMKSVQKHSLFGDAMTSNLVLMGAQKNLEEMKASIAVNTAKALAPVEAGGEMVETEAYKQAELQAKAAEDYSAESAEKNVAIYGKAAKLLAKGGASIDMTA